MTESQRLRIVLAIAGAATALFALAVCLFGCTDGRGEAVPLARPAPDVLLFGSSVDRDCREDDPEQRTLPELVDAALGPGLSAAGIYHGAYYGPVFARYATHVVRIAYPCRLVVIQVNLRSLGSAWSEDPNWAFNELDKALGSWEPQTPLRERISGALEVYPVIRLRKILDFAPRNLTPPAAPYVVLRTGESFTLEEFREVQIGRPTDEAGRRRKYRTQFMAHYDYDLDDDSPTLRGLLDAGRILRSSGRRVVFYVTPLDVQGARRYDRRTARAIRRNTDAVCARLRREGFPALDLVDLVDGEEFIDRRFTLEHISGAAKTQVAGKIAAKARELLRDASKE